MIQKMIRKRITSPNNATSYLYNYLVSIGIEITTVGKRNYAHINNKKYGISLTGSDKGMLDCRQYEEGLSGLLSFYEANGQIYLVDDCLLDKSCKTREMNNKEFITVESKEPIAYLKPTSFIKQLDSEEYKDMYIEESKLIASELVKKCTERMLNRY